MTAVWIALIAMTLGGFIGFGFAVWFFGIDNDCARHVHNAWDSGYEEGFNDACEGKPWAMSKKNPHKVADDA